MVKPSTNMTAIYKLTNVNYNYGTTIALHDLSLTLNSGKFYGIVGPNGCGKTTLLDLLVGSKTPATGSVQFLEKSLAEYSKRQLAQQVALVPQEFEIGFDYTVEELVLMGRHPYIPRFGTPSAEDMALVDEAMRVIGIDHFGTRLVTELSGGEKQRVVVARALAQDTPVLLFDEATSNLDVRYTLQIFNGVKSRVQSDGRTVIAVIHNLNLAAAYCDELIFMEQGHIRQMGSVEEVLTAATIQAVFGVDASVKYNDFSKATQVAYRYGK